jgi:hypothetical protein
MKELSPASRRHAGASLAATAACTLLLGTLPLQARADDSCPRLDVPAHFELQLLAEADQGLSALRSFIEISKPVYDVELVDVVAWMDALRAGKCPQPG